MIHLDIQGYLDLSYSSEKEYMVACGKAYWNVTRCDICLFLKYKHKLLLKNEEICPECYEIYKRNWFKICRAYFKRENVDFKDLK